jgi:lysophospholipase L1-like esterase
MQDILFTTTFEILTDAPIIISTGRTLGYIKIHNKQIELYKSSSGYNSAELNEQFDLSSLQKGISYDIGFHKTITGITFFLKGGSLTFEKTYDIDKNYMQNVMRGKPFFEIESGSIRIYKSILSANYNNSPKVSVFGDSFIEGIALNQYGLNLSNRWCVKLANKIGVKDCFLDGKGGEKVSIEWLNRLKLENSWYKSEYVILSIGVNSYDNIVEYKQYMKQIIDYLKNNGQIPILVTVTPRSTFEYNSTTRIINDWVKSSGEKYIDIHKAVTKEEDASKWKDGYVLPDGLHPTIFGYEAMYEQVKKDCLFLF